MSDQEESGPPESEQTLSKTVMIPVAEKERPASTQDDLWHISVEVVGGPMDGLRSLVEKPAFTIGRDATNDLPLHMDPMVSARHACIVREGQHFWLADLDSRNGVFIGDRKLTERVLISPGTTFTLGRTQLEFMPR